MHRQIVRVPLAGLTAAIAILASSAITSAADLSSPIVSGLPWRSGASCADSLYAFWRGGRRLDANVVFAPAASWTAMEDYAKSPSFRGKVGLSPQLVVSMPMMPKTAPKRHAACARGDFDGHFRRIGAALRAAGAGRALVRLGWEYNRGSHDHPWGIDTAAEIPAYVACFRHEAKALKSAAPGLRIEWTNGRSTRMPVSPTLAYPGNDVVDVVGIHYYDNPEFPRQSTQAEWDRQSTMTYAGGPMGIATWLPWAAAQGKKLAISEWAVWGVQGFIGAVDAKGDDPVYVRNMHAFFRAHAGAIAYENYFDCLDRHRIFPASLFPRASAAYQQLWSAGQ
jgi:hypothetical protein